MPSPTLTLGGVASLLIAIVALQHVAFLVLEMFLWTKPIGRSIFRQTLDQAKASAALAANQGLYNGFLAAGLAWSLLHPDAGMAGQLAVFFLGCVVVAAGFGAATVSRRILYVQGGPAVLGLGAVALGW